MPNLAQYQRGFGRRKPGPWARLDGQHPLSKGILGCWLFNEGGGLPHDISGKNKNPTLGAGTINWSAGPYGPAFKFDGSTYLDAGASVFTSAAYTIYFRFMPAVITTYQAIVSCYTADNNSAEVFVYQPTPGQMYGGSFTGGARSGASTIAANTWVSVWFASSASGVAANFYINGVLNTETGGTPTFTTFTPHTCFGARPSGANKLANGTLLSEVMIWNRALSAAEIAQHYQQPFAMLLQPAPSRAFFGPAAGGSIPGSVFLLSA